MKETSGSLMEAFKQAEYIVSGHGSRKIKVLQEAFQHMDGEMDSDHYGSGETIEQFQRQMAEVLGKESAIFFPSGTMSQQIALRIYCDRKGLKRVAYHPLCHIEIHEENTLKELHQIEAVLLGEKNRLIRLEDVKAIEGNIACLLLELPQREIGGQLPAYEELEAISAYCREQGIKLHLDGARLFEITPYYQKSAAEICSLFDSVYVSFYKGIGGIAGAVLAGDADMMQESRVWKRRFGGDLIGLYPYILSSQYYFDQRKDKMGIYYEHAKQLAAMLNQCHAVRTLPEVPVSNMFHVHIALAQAEAEPVFSKMTQQFGIGLTSYLNESSETEHCSFELSLGDRYETVPQDQLQSAFVWLDKQLRALVPKS
ncbi:low specificity L-threonine aldolase [Paenibacillus xylanilyticus]